MNRIIIILSLIIICSKSTNTSTRSIFDDWCVKFERHYSTEKEKQERFQIWLDNKKIVNRLNEQNKGIATFTVDNPFGDISRDEYIGYFKKSKVSIPSNLSSLRLHLRGGNRNEDPESIDWRDKKAVTEVKDQIWSKCNSGYAFSSIGAIESACKIVSGELLDLSEQEVIDCIEPFSDLCGCDGGSPWATFYYAMNGGMALESEYPYKAIKQECKIVAGHCVVKNYAYVPLNSELSLRCSVVEQPVSVTVDASSEGFQFYSSRIFAGPCSNDQKDLSHGILVIGYGKDLHGNLFWILRNSFSKKWGESGYMRLIRTETSGKPGACGVAAFPWYPWLGQ